MPTYPVLFVLLGAAALHFPGRWARSLVVVLLAWVYFSAQILLLGAEFTHAYAKLRGARLRPEPQAVALTEEARAQQGIPHRETVERAIEASDGR